MTLLIVHLSDIHFTNGPTPLQDRVEALAAAISTVDRSVQTCILVFSGDVAQSGKVGEYEAAEAFLCKLSDNLRARVPGLVLEVVCVPGNHDCILPEEETTLRDSLIAGIKPSLQSAAPDSKLLSTLLGAQSAFWAFAERAEGNLIPEDKQRVARTRSFALNDERKAHFFLVNTALLSRRSEKQGQLEIPMNLVKMETPESEEGGVYISVFHHSYVWITSNVAIEFRALVEQVSDFALSGHQHFPYKAQQETDFGSTLTYLEGGALQDENYALQSQFGVIAYDLERSEQRIVSFRWKSDYYQAQPNAGWKARTFNTHSRHRFIVTPHFLVTLSDPGIPLLELPGGPLKLQDIFVAPDLSVKKRGADPVRVAGDSTISYLSGIEYGLCSGSYRSGKSALASMLFLSTLYASNVVPLLLNGRLIISSDPREIDKLISQQFTAQYEQRSDGTLEKYLQMSRSSLCLIVDDWHLSKLTKARRKIFVDHVRKMFGKAIFFCSDVFRFEDAADGIDPKTDLLDCEDMTILEFGHVARGKLIDRWVFKMNPASQSNEREAQKTIEETERVLLNVMGKNTLPSLPFIIICILQARESGGVTNQEAGSFGYLYEVLVTMALNRSKAPEVQLDKKFTILSNLAYFLLKNREDNISIEKFMQSIDEYSSSYRVKVNSKDILEDLLNARVLTERDGNLSFMYPHYYYYFVARHFRDSSRKTEAAEEARQIVNHMVDHIGREEYSAIIMFLVYFTKDVDIINRLISNADLVFHEKPLCRLEEDVSFLEVIGKPGRRIEVPEQVDPAEVRSERRKARDEAQAALVDDVEEIDSYSDDMPNSLKIRLGFRHMELLGQIVRNFPGSLEGDEKLLILDASYRIGLRILAGLMEILRIALRNSREELSRKHEEAIPSKQEELKELSDLFDEMVRMVADMSCFAIIKKLSSCLGLADIEDAYPETAVMVGESTATRLINFSIRLDHMDGFPEDEVRRLHRTFKDNGIALESLRILVAQYMMVIGLESHKTRQSISKLLGIESNSPSILGQARRRFATPPHTKH